MPDILDTVIIGAGPAGITAGIYSACYRMKAVIIGKITGGAMLDATKIVNYPGQPPVPGRELTEKMVTQLTFLGSNIIADSVAHMSKIPDGYQVKTEGNQIFETKTVIMASGTERRKLNIPGEREFSGKGVFYCATCDAHYYDNRIVAVIGGSNAAVQAAVLLAERAKKVFIIYRGDALRADPIWVEQVNKSNTIEVLYGTNITRIHGEGWVTSVLLDGEHNGTSELPLDGVFIEIGGIPGTSLLLPLGVKLDEKGFIEINSFMETNIFGIYAAGDCTTTGNMLQQISVAVGEGAKAAGFVYFSLRNIRPPALWGKLWTSA